ncbi:MAG: AtpZ/AtpI family protein [SAR202 cluster bacterium]|nr:AtpZ/AtpI family protein [SAR202 cluster bacterium]
MEILAIVIACTVGHFEQGIPVLDGEKLPIRSKDHNGEPCTSKVTSRNPADSGLPAMIRLLGRVGGIGWFVATAIALGTYGGYWLDRHFSTAPVLTIVGLALGLATALVGMIQLLRSNKFGR